MTAGDQHPVLSFVVHREADARLRGRSGPLRARVCWPARAGTRPALLVYLPDEPDRAHIEALCRNLCGRTGMVVLAAEKPASYEDAVTLLEWAADHASELDADPERLLVAGGDLATAVHRHAGGQGWPRVTYYVVDT